MKAKITKKAQSLYDGISKMAECGICEVLVSAEQFDALVDAFEKNKKESSGAGIFTLNVSGKEVLIQRGAIR